MQSAGRRLAVDEYTRRLRGALDVETVWHKTGAGLERRLTALSPTICLDPRGRECESSERFATLLYDRLDRGGSRLYLGIGPAEGFSESMRASSELLSLSKLTFPHQMARVILMEQLYRSDQLRKGTGYHK